MRFGLDPAPDRVSRCAQWLCCTTQSDAAPAYEETLRVIEILNEQIQALQAYTNLEVEVLAGK